MNTKLRRSVLAIAMGLAVAGSAVSASAATSLPAVQHEGTVAFVTGGIGESEAAAMEHATAKWPMTLEFAVHDGKRADFAAGVQVRVLNAEHKVVLDTQSNGPFVLAKVEPGRYMVDATLAGKTLQREVTVTKGGHARTVFEWPAGTDQK